MQFIHIEVHIENCKKKRISSILLHLALFLHQEIQDFQNCQGHFLHNYIIFKLIYLVTYRALIFLLTHHKSAFQLNFKIFFETFFFAPILFHLQ